MPFFPNTIGGLVIDPRRIGMLTPSSNTVLEPYTAAMLAPLGAEASAHFQRFRVVEISLRGEASCQFEHAPIVEAAERLAEAKMHVIAWNATAAAWLGLDADRALCAAITNATGIPATSTMLAYEEIFGTLGVRRLGLVTPYLTEVQDKIIATFAANGIEVVADRRLEDRGNYSFANYSPEQIEGLTREVIAESAPDAVAILCTNFRGAPIAAAVEADTGVPVIDSVSVTAAASLSAVGIDPARVTQWGSVFNAFAAGRPPGCLTPPKGTS